MDVHKSGDKLDSLGQLNRDLGEIEQAPRQASNVEAEALLMTVNSVIGELSESVTVIIGLSEFLLAQIDQNDPITTDLNTIAKQTKRMSEIIKGINNLTR